MERELVPEEVPVHHLGTAMTEADSSQSSAMCGCPSLHHLPTFACLQAGLIYVKTSLIEALMKFFKLPKTQLKHTHLELLREINLNQVSRT